MGPPGAPVTARRVLLVAAMFALACGSGDVDFNGQPEIKGIWALQRDDGIWVVREFMHVEGTSENWCNDYAYADGDEPALLRRGNYIVGDDTPIPGGLVADDVITVFPTDGILFRYDLLIRVNDKHLVLKSVVDDSVVTYDRVDALP